MSQRASEAFYVGGTGSDPERFRQGWAWLIATVEASGSKTAYVIVSKMSQVAGITSDVIGEAAAKVLSNGGPIPLANGTRVLSLLRPDVGPFHPRSGADGVLPT